MTDWVAMLNAGDFVGIAQALLSDTEYVDFALLREDPQAALNEIAGVTVQIQEALPEGACGGGYYDRTTSTIYVHPASPRRNNFTLLHELGHHIQQHHPEWAFVLLDDLHPLGRRKVEEKVSDSLAAEVLLRSALTDDMDPFVQSPALVMAGLHENSEASRAAALEYVNAILLHQSKWILAVADLEGRVKHARATYDQFPPKRQMIQPGFARLAAETGGSGLTRRNFTEGLIYQRGRELHDMKAEATLDWTGKYIFVALTPIARFGMGTLEAAWYSCSREGCAVDDYCAETESEWCSQCNEPRCRGCNDCGCESRTQSTQCPSCYMQISAYEAAKGLHECW